MNAVTTSVKKISREKNNQYVKTYRANHRDTFNSYMLDKVKSRYANNEEVRLKISMYGKLRWYNKNIQALEAKESLSSREEKRLTNLKTLRAELENI